MAAPKRLTFCDREGDGSYYRKMAELRRDKRPASLAFSFEGVIFVGLFISGAFHSER